MRTSTSKTRLLILLAATCILTGCEFNCLYAQDNTDTQITSLPANFFTIIPFSWNGRPDWMTNPDIQRQQELKAIKECGFNTAGFVTAKDLPFCEKLNLPAIIVPNENFHANTRDWIKLTDEQIEERVRKLIGEAGTSECIIGYYIMDEPAVTDFPALAKAVAAVKKYASGKLAYINLFPNYASLGVPGRSQLGTKTYIEYLEKFVNEVKPQFISYDNYLVQFSQDTKVVSGRRGVEKYYTNLLDARTVALKYNLPFWHIVSSNQVRSHTPIPSPANLLLQVYTTLASGAHGLSWYTYYSDGYAYTPVNPSGHKTATWQFLKMINDQVKVLGPIVNRLESTGVFFTSPPPASADNTLPLLPGDVVKAIKSDVPIMIGEFSDNDGSEYVMTVNLSLEKSTKIFVETHNIYETIEIISPVDGQSILYNKHYDVDADKGGLWLTAGQGKLIKFSKKQAEKQNNR